MLVREWFSSQYDFETVKLGCQKVWRVLNIFKEEIKLIVREEAQASEREKVKSTEKKVKKRKAYASSRRSDYIFD